MVSYARRLLCSRYYHWFQHTRHLNMCWCCCCHDVDCDPLTQKSLPLSLPPPPLTISFSPFVPLSSWLISHYIKRIKTDLHVPKMCTARRRARKMKKKCGMAKKKKIIIVWSRSVSLVLVAYRTYMQRNKITNGLPAEDANTSGESLLTHPIQAHRETGRILYIFKKEQMKVQPANGAKSRESLSALTLSVFILSYGGRRIPSFFIVCVHLQCKHHNQRRAHHWYPLHVRPPCIPT